MSTETSTDLSQSLPSEIFKAYDIRGIVGKSLNPDIVRLIGLAIGSTALDNGDSAIIVGRDGRVSGPAMAGALSEGILSSGCNVVDIGMVPTPVVYFATNTLGGGSSVSVTGSHNPPDYNGFKIMIAGTSLSGDAITALRTRIIKGDLRRGQGTLRSEAVLDKYVERIASDIKLDRPLNIVLDCGNGVAGAVAPQLFRAIGCEVTELFSEVDGTFPNHHPDPSDPANLQDLIKTVQKTGADFGLALDGDGDRLGVVTPDGSIIWPDRQMILFARDILARNPGAEIIYDVKCSRTLPAAIKEAGGVPTMWKTGHSFIKAKLRETGAALAGEMSGHIFFKERWYGFDDGLYTGARLCELLSKQSAAPQEVFAALPDSINTPEIRIDTNEGEQHQLIKELVSSASFPEAEVSKIDGLRVDFTDGFGLARASNTTPMVIMRFEADSKTALQRIQTSFKQLFAKVRADIKLPF